MNICRWTLTSLNLPIESMNFSDVEGVCPPPDAHSRPKEHAHVLLYDGANRVCLSRICAGKYVCAARMGCQSSLPRHSLIYADTERKENVAGGPSPPRIHPTRIMHSSVTIGSLTNYDFLSFSLCVRVSVRVIVYVFVYVLVYAQGN